MDESSDNLKSVKKILPNDSVDNMENTFKELDTAEKPINLMQTPDNNSPTTQFSLEASQKMLDIQPVPTMEQKDTLMTLQSNKDVIPPAKKVDTYINEEIIYYANWGLFLCSIQMLFSLFVWYGGGIGLILCMGCGLAVKILLHKVEKAYTYTLFMKRWIPIVILISIILVWNAVLILYLIAEMATQCKHTATNHLYNVVNTSNAKLYEVITSCFSQLIILAPCVISYVMCLKHYRAAMSLNQ